MEKKFAFEFTAPQVDLIYKALLEMPAKLALPVMKEVEQQLNAQQNENGDKQGV